MRVVTVIFVLAIVASGLVLLRSSDTPAAPATEISARPAIMPVIASGVTVPRREQSRRVVRRTFDDGDRDAAMALMFLLSAPSGSRTR